MATADELQHALAERDAEISRLTAEIDKLRPPSQPKTPVPDPYPDGRATVTTLRAPVVLPPESDLRRLLTIVTNRFPQLKPKLDPRWAEKIEAEYFATFRAAFFWLSFVIRGDAIDKKRDAEYWMGLGQQWLRGQQFNPCTLQLNSFTAAVVAQSDVLFTPLDKFPYVLRFGLTGFTSPDRLLGRWRELLRAGEC
jgi:hypothetical protein